MTDPEIEHARLVSGNPAAVRARVETLRGALHDLTGVREDLVHAAGLPRWSGPAAEAFAVRMGGLRTGLRLTRAAVQQARGALDAAATACETAESHADHYIAYWRNRPADLPPVVEELYARLINGLLLGVGRTYNQQLAGIGALLTGDEVDLDELDEETRKWVEEGLAKNEEWLAGNDSDLGPIIPNTAATGDGRGLIPQGLGYDPTSNTLVQGYYTKDGQSHLALIDELTGREIGEAQLGGHYYVEGRRVEGSGPHHAGGVTVVGDQVLVTDKGKVFTYDLADVRNARKGEPVPLAGEPQSVSGGSYSAYHDGRLYLGDHGGDKLHVYSRGSGGTWEKDYTIDTPEKSQGVLVRDHELVFSTSYGRHQDHSTLVVQDRDGNRSDPYELPSMSQGVVEVDGELVVTYESGAEEFDGPAPGTAGWWWGRDDYQDLWSNPYMTRTPLSELGLVGGGDYDVEPETLGSAAAELVGPASGLKSVGSELDGVRVPSHLLGEVPEARVVSRAVEKLLGAAADSARTGSRAVTAAGELLRSSATDYSRADAAVRGAMQRMTPS